MTTPPEICKECACTDDDRETHLCSYHQQVQEHERRRKEAQDELARVPEILSPSIGK